MSYFELAYEQEELLKGEFFGHLCTTLAVLSNLREVILTNFRRTKELCWCQKSYVDGHSRTYQPFSDDRYPELKSMRPPPVHTCMTSFDGLNRCESNIWPQVLHALYTSGNTKVKTISTDVGSSGLILSAFDLTLRESYCAAKVLPQLTSLNLHLDTNVTDEGYHEPHWIGLIAETLSGAINLKCLAIEVVQHSTDFEDEVRDDGKTSFDMILEDCKMPRVVTFGLTSLTFSEAGMTRFLQHSQGIRHMSLKDIRMNSGSWENMFRTIKGSLALKTIEFESLYGVVAELSKAGFDCERYEPYPAIKNYLLGGGPNPFSTAALGHAVTDNSTQQSDQDRGLETEEEG